MVTPGPPPPPPPSDATVSTQSKTPISLQLLTRVMKLSKYLLSFEKLIISYIDSIQSLKGTIKPIIKQPKTYCFGNDFRLLFLVSIAWTTLSI